MVERHGQTLPQAGQSWQEWLVANACSFRHALLAYRDGARLHAGTRPRGVHLEGIEAKLHVLCEAGFEPEQAMGLMLAISRFVVGWVLEEQAAPGGPVSGEVPDALRYPLSARGWRALANEPADVAFARQIHLFAAGAQAMLAARD